MDETTIANTMRRAGALGRPVVREFVIDFLGGLIPGLIFLVAIVAALILPAWSAFGFFLPGLAADAAQSFTTRIDPAATILLLIFPVLLLLLATAYVFGHLFFRQDPKDADQASFDKIARRDDGTGMARTLKCKSGNLTLVEFPYHFLKNYLLDRGILYLADTVPWGPIEPDEFRSLTEDQARDRLNRECGRRAKHFVNALKLRIQASSPASFTTLARNEAHVRLSSSLWYVCRALVWTSFIGGALCLLPTVVSPRPFAIAWNPERVDPVIALPIAVFLSAMLIRRAVEHALHYQREREVLFILETAYWLKLNGVAPRMFEGLGGPGPSAPSV